MNKKNILFWIDLIVLIIYMMCLLTMTLYFDQYQIAYPDHAFDYIIKLIVITSLVYIRAYPYVLDIEQSIVFRIIFWASMLSVVPDIIRCFFMYT